MEHEDVVEFGLFRLWPARRFLTRDGVPVPLGDRAFDILVALIDAAPGIVDKDRLIERVWPGLFVEEGNLRVQMNQLRKALGDGERYVQTVPGRGYCFVAPVARSKVKAKIGAGKTYTPDGTNLPRYLTDIIGRQDELAELKARLEQHRLVTLTGPGGVGKTRLAIELGWRRLPDFPAGVWLVDLAPLADPAAVVRATASVVGAKLEKDALAIEAIAAVLGKRPRLLIFDNCEHLAIAAAELIQALLERVSTLSVLTTSQQTLQIPAEQVYPLPPLDVPPVGVLEIGSFAAAELFVERARAADRSLELDPQNQAGVAEICRRLDGLPLAIEMAAARLRPFGVDGLLTGLVDRLRLLKGPQSLGSARHSSLRAVVEWSHGLLEPSDQDLFRKLAVFPGSFSLDDTLAVGEDGRLGRWEIMDALGKLVDRSLVTTDRTFSLRYRLLETLRLYAGEMLSASGDREEVAERHARHFVGVFDHAYLAWENTPDEEWIALYRPQIDNLRAALDWALAKPERRSIALALGGGGLRLFSVLSLVGEGLSYFAKLVSLIDENTPAGVAAAVLRHAHSFPWEAPALRQIHLERAVSLCRQLDDRVNLGEVLVRIGYFEMQLGRQEQAKSHLDEAAVLIGQSDLKKLRMALYGNIGANALLMGRFDEARAYFAQVPGIMPGSRDAIRIIGFQAVLEYSVGDVGRAIEYGRTAVRESRTISGPFLGHELINLGAYLLANGDVEEARSRIEEAFEHFAELGSVLLSDLQVCAVLAAFEGGLADSARIIGFVDAGRARAAAVRMKTEDRLYGELCRRLEAGMTEARLAALKDEGAGWTKEQAIGFIERHLLKMPGNT